MFLSLIVSRWNCYRDDLWTISSQPSAPRFHPATVRWGPWLLAQVPSLLRISVAPVQPRMAVPELLMYSLPVDHDWTNSHELPTDSNNSLTMVFHHWSWPKVSQPTATINNHNEWLLLTTTMIIESVGNSWFFTIDHGWTWYQSIVNFIIWPRIYHGLPSLKYQPDDSSMSRQRQEKPMN